MKPYIIRKIEELIQKTSHLTDAGSGNLFLSDNGEYKSASGGASFSILEYIADSNNQIFNINAQAGYLYEINSSSYTGTTVALSATTKGNTITIKNVNNDKPIKISTPIDGQQNILLDPHNAITVVYTGTSWIIAQDHLISYLEKRKLQERIEALEVGGSYIYPESKTSEFTVTNEDNMKFFDCSGTFRIYLPNCTTIPTGFNFYIKNNGTGVVTVACAISTQVLDTINSKTVTPNECLHVICAGTKYVSSHTASFISS